MSSTAGSRKSTIHTSVEAYDVERVFQNRVHRKCQREPLEH